jgi:hypothetical protein
LSRDRKDTAAAEHHYFPKGLQKFWRDDLGWVHRLRSDGKRDKSKNGTFGHVRNAHHIKLADEPSPWDESFEYIFGPIDSAVPKVINALAQVEAPIADHNLAWRDRLAPQWGLETERRSIAQLVASLVVRSPNVRNLIRLTVSSFYNGELPWPDGKVPQSLISANQKPLLERYGKALSERGKFAILLSDHREFVFGDGLLNNFHSGGAISPHNPRCLVPLTPTIAIAYNCPSQYHVSANFAAIRVSPEEVEEVNWLTQVYSGQYLYYRAQLPADLSSFRVGHHQQVPYHQNAWLDALMDSIANTWF